MCRLYQPRWPYSSSNSLIQKLGNNLKTLEIIQIDESTFPLAEKFIKPYEERCISLASLLRHKDPHIYLLFLSKNVTVIPGSVSRNFTEIAGILYLNRTIFHCIPETHRLDKDSLKNCLCKLLDVQEYPVKCISGEAQATQLIKECLESKLGEPFQTNHYNLMTAEKIVSPLEELCNGDEILRCSENDLEELFPIQKMYMNEEVATYGRKVTDAEVSIGLRQILKNQLCLALQSDGEIVAKANTNAIGIDWIQLGGIYTHPLYRRNGYACQLISAICRRTAKAGKKNALFVKDINVPAMELYKKLGFSNSGLYEICYY